MFLICHSILAVQSWALIYIPLACMYTVVDNHWEHLQVKIFKLEVNELKCALQYIKVFCAKPILIRYLYYSRQFASSSTFSNILSIGQVKSLKANLRSIDEGDGGT